MSNWELVEVKRAWIPKWLFAALCFMGRRWMLHQPFRWMLFQKVEPLPAPPSGGEK